MRLIEHVLLLSVVCFIVSFSLLVSSPGFFIKDTSWEAIFKALHNKVSGEFALKQLSYFAAWKVHHGGTPENTLLAGKFAFSAYMKKTFRGRILTE